MNIRENFSAVLVSLGIILAFLPLSANRSFVVRPQKLLSEVLTDDNYLSVDQVAKYIVSEDKTIQILDLRTPDEFSISSIPGAINIPYGELLDKNPDLLFSNEKNKKILYSNGDLESNYALVIAKGLNFKNVYVMKGGLNEWYKTVMNSRFTGDRISPRENSLFENRTKARNLFTEINSLPDSLKLKFIQSKHIAAKKLDGGCE